MDVSGCRATFSETELQRFLDRATYKRFDRLRTDNEIRKVQNHFFSSLNSIGQHRRTSLLSLLSLRRNPRQPQRHRIRMSMLSHQILSHLSHQNPPWTNLSRSPSPSPSTFPANSPDKLEIQAEKSRNPRQIVEEAMSEAMVRKCNQ